MIYFTTLSIALGLYFGFASLVVHAKTDLLGPPTQFSKASAPFYSGPSLQGISFAISSPNQKQGNTVLVTPIGLKGDNASVSLIIHGKSHWRQNCRSQWRWLPRNLYLR